MSQHDLSQEVPATGMEKFLEDNFRKLVWLFIIVVIAIIAYGFIRHQSTLKANEAAEAFTSAKTVEDCDLVISRYAGTNAAANALLLKADLLWDQNKKTSAVDALKEFTSKHSSVIPCSCTRCSDSAPSSTPWATARRRRPSLSAS
jgi:predicted negative regulator of RcsB-dependent stress response